MFGKRIEVGVCTIVRIDHVVNVFVSVINIRKQAKWFVKSVRNKFQATPLKRFMILL